MTRYPLVGPIPKKVNVIHYFNKCKGIAWSYAEGKLYVSIGKVDMRDIRYIYPDLNVEEIIYVDPPKLFEPFPI